MIQLLSRCSLISNENRARCPVLPVGKLRWPAALVCALMLFATRAHADPSITPPRPAHAFDVPYPSGGEGDERVVVHLTVDDSGAVRQIEVVSGSEPFASAVRRAASGFRFIPATRDGKAIASKVPFAVTFEAVGVDSAGRDVDSAANEPDATLEQAPAPEPLDVTVQGTKRQPAATTLGSSDVERIPGAFGDPFRAVDALPGITPIASGVPYFFVRGAAPGNVGALLDDIPIPLLFHVGAGPGVIHPALVESVSFHPGGYPARYGRFAGGLVTAETRAPRPEWHGEVSVRAVDAGALVEAPWAEGRGTALVAGRYSYTAAILSLVSSDVDLGYWDYQARVSYDLTARDRVTAFGFGSGDTLADESAEPDATLFDGSYHRLDLRYDRRLEDRGKLGLRVLLGLDESLGDGGRYLDDRKIGTRMFVEQPLADGVLWRAGTDLVVDDYESRFDEVVEDVIDESSEIDDAFAALFPSRTDVALGVWTDLELDLGRGSTLVPGLRVDVYRSQRQTAVGVDPRLAARLATGRRVWLVPAVGIAHQLPSFIPGPSFQIAGIRGGLQRGIQSSFGVEADLPLDAFGRVTVFRNVIVGLTDPLGATRGGGLGTDRFTTRTTGDTIGLEVFVRRALSRTVGGYLSYTLSRSTRTFEDGRTLLSTFDRTHVFSAALSWDLGARWNAGTRTMFYSGFPADEFNIYRARSQNPDRTEPFFRLDLRLAKEWRVTERFRLQLVLELQNALFREEVVDVECDIDGCAERKVGPITIPSMGVIAVF